VADGNPEHLALFACIGEGSVSVFYSQIDKLADVFESRIAHERAGKKTGFTKDLKAIADADDQATRRGKFTHLIHDGREFGNGAGAQVITIGKAARDNDGVTIFQVVRIMPEHGRLLSGGGNGRIVTILIAIGAGKDDDAKFHKFILTTKDTKEKEE
jgi:hypothetical protein